MSDSKSADDGRIDEEQLAATVTEAVVAALADARDGGGGEAEQESQDGGDLSCEFCGRDCANAGALATHEAACDGEAESGGESHDGADPISPDGLDAGDVPAIVRDASEARAEATAENLGRAAGDMDAGPRDTAAKALVRAMGGEKSQYVAAFGECACEGCERGRNGLTAERCFKCEKSQDGDGDAGDAGDGGGESPDGDGMTRAQYEAALVSEGMSATEAAEAAEARFA